METGLSQTIKNAFGLSDTDPKSVSSLALAYIGDAVYELVIRTLMVNEGGHRVGRMHDAAEKLVKANAQSELVKSIIDDLTDEEFVVYKRGRNAKSVSMPKNAKMSDYRMATGLEALIGWLYLTGKDERILELVKSGLSKTGALS